MRLGRSLAIWGIIALLLVGLFNQFENRGGSQRQDNLVFSDFLAEVDAGGVEEVVLRGPTIVGRRGDGREFRTFAPEYPDLVGRLSAAGVRIEAAPIDDGMPNLLNILITWFPFLLFISVWIFFMRQMQSGGGKALGFGRSRARLLNEKSGRVTFDDIAGIDEAKHELEEVVEFLRDPGRFQRLGGRIPKGVLLVGPPGTGKTLLARAIAGEADVPFFTISGSDFVEMFVGVGASRVRDMFEQGKKSAPCIIFIDEIDAVGRHRGAGLGGGNDEREQTLNQLLVEMDGFETNEGVILIAATNRPDVLDPALLRPGRFDRQVIVPNPDIAGRERILKVHMRKVPLAEGADAHVIARGTPGFSGADLANLVNEAALLAARRRRKAIGMAELEDAKDKVMMGSERRSMVMTEEEKKLTAYHEAGHALCTVYSPASHPIHKATIIPRGQELGMVMRLPERDEWSRSRAQLEADLTVAYGGRVAEELIFGVEKITTGAANDIKQATHIARRMITEWGFSDRLGPVRMTDNQEEIFLGHSVTQQKNVSERTARMVDEEVRGLIERSEGRARVILTEHEDELRKLAEGLLEYETLTGEEIGDVLANRPIERSPRDEAKPPPKRASVPRSQTRPSGPFIAPSPQPQE